MSGLSQFELAWESTLPGETLTLGGVEPSGALDDSLLAWVHRAEEYARDRHVSRAFSPLTSDGFLHDTVESVSWERSSQKVSITKRMTHTPRLENVTVDRVSEEAWQTELGRPYLRQVASELWGAQDSTLRKFTAMTSDSPVSFDPSWSAVVRDVVTLQDGIAIVGGHALLAESLVGANYYRYLRGLYRMSDGGWVWSGPKDAVAVPQRADGRMRVLLRQLWSNNFGHLLIDILPRIVQLQGRYPLQDCAFVVSDYPDGSPLPRLIEQILGRYGIGPGQIEAAPPAAHYDEIVVLGKVSDGPTRHAPVAVEWLRAVGDTVGVGSSDKIYVRKTTRRPSNEDEILRLVEGLGFSVVETGTMSLSAQMEAFKGARYVVGSNGADLTNLVFSPEEVGVVALSPENMNHDFFYDLLCHRERSRYLGLQGRVANAGAGYARSNFHIDMKQFRRAMAWLLHG